MNEILRPHRDFPPLPETTRDGDGLPRRKWNVHELQKMLEIGILGDHDRLELFGGDLIAMSPRGRHHEVLKVALNKHWGKICPPELTVAQETAFRLDDHNEPEPDFIAYPASILAPDVRGDTVLLVVEVADSSLGHDLGRKAARYCAFGVREYWVINAVGLMTTVFRDPGPGGLASRTEVAGDQRLVPALAPALALRLDDLAST